MAFHEFVHLVFLSLGHERASPLPNDIVIGWDFEISLETSTAITYNNFCHAFQGINARGWPWSISRIVLDNYCELERREIDGIKLKKLILTRSSFHIQFLKITKLIFKKECIRNFMEKSAVYHISFLKYNMKYFMQCLYLMHLFLFCTELLGHWNFYIITMQ